MRRQLDHVITRRRVTIGTCAGLVTTALVGVIGATSAHAAGAILYAATAGSGDCSSPATPCSFTTALTDVTEGDTVQLAGGTYVGVHAIGTAITVTSAPGEAVTLDGAGNTVLNVTSVVSDVAATIENLTIQDSGSSGEGIHITAGGAVTLNDVHLAQDHLGIVDDGSGTLTINGSNLGPNTAGDVAASAGATVAVNGSAFHDSPFGILDSGAGTIDATHSTFRDESYAIDGTSISDQVAELGESTISGALIVALRVDHGTASVQNSTITGSAVGVESQRAGIQSSTIADNAVGLLENSSDWYLSDSIIAGSTNADCEDLQGQQDFGANIDSDGSCELTDPTSESASATIAGSLEPLASNGGPTQTMALTPGSPAIGLVTPASDFGYNACGGPNDGIDERGVTRHEGSCDAGAYEASAPEAADVQLVVSPSNGAALSTQPLHIVVQVTGHDSTVVPRGMVFLYANGLAFGCGGVDVTIQNGQSYLPCTTTSKFAPGTYTLVAKYRGDATYQPARDTFGPLVITRAPTTTTVSAAKSGRTGHKISVTARTTHPAHTATPTGTVTFTDNGRKVATVKEPATGRATAKIKLVKGRNVIKASYGGNTYFKGSSGAATTTGKS
jgi:hypothetical protein